jgi:hypothetical protein
MDFFLWSRAAVMQLIEQECGLKLGVRTVGKYLARWGFTPQKPIKRAYEQRPEAVKAWLDEHYPAIEEQAKAEGGEIHWGDETALVNTDVRGRCYAPAGETPVAYTVGSTRQKLSMIATVTNRGQSALDDHRRGLQLGPTDRIFGGVDQGCRAKSLSDSGQPAGCTTASQ